VVEFGIHGRLRACAFLRRAGSSPVGGIFFYPKGNVMSFSKPRDLMATLMNGASAATVYAP